MEEAMKTATVGLIASQSEILVEAERLGYVSIKADAGNEDEQCVRIHAANLDALIALLMAAKKEVLDAKE